MSRFFIHRPVFAGVIAIVIVLAGLVASQLLPGQFVRVRVIAGTQQAIVVPQTAVMENESGRFVWVAGGDGKAMQRAIRAGSWLGSDWVVLEGLKPGDTVIVDNLVRLRPGTPVQVKKAG